MNRAMNRDRGVSSTTASVIFQLMDSMNNRVPRMVTTPVNSWVKPISRPSES